MDGVAKELGWAVQNIRQEVVERPMFGRAVTPEVTRQMDTQANRETLNQGQQKQSAPSHDDLYGKGQQVDKWRDIVNEQSQSPQAHKQAAEWEKTKNRAENFYGHEPTVDHRAGEYEQIVQDDPDGWQRDIEDGSEHMRDDAPPRDVIELSDLYGERADQDFDWGELYGLSPENDVSQDKAQDLDRGDDFDR